MLPKDRCRAARRNLVWTADFHFDQICICRLLKCLNLTSKFIGQALVIKMEQAMTVNHVIAVQEMRSDIDGEPAFARMNIENEVMSNSAADYVRLSASQNSFTDAGSPGPKRHTGCHAPVNCEMSSWKLKYLLLFWNQKLGPRTTAITEISTNITHLWDA